MRLQTLATLSIFIAGLLAPGLASATPIISIDGVNVPVGTSPTGFVKTTETSFESLVLVPTNELYGITAVTAIQAQGGFPITYTYGAGGVYLASVFKGFIADSVVAPTPTTPGTITFTGGQLKYYVSNTDHFNPNTGTAASDMAAIEMGQLWLSLLPAPIDAAGHTLIITIPMNTSLTTFAGASASAFLDVVGGDAAFAFNTNNFVNFFSTTGVVDVDFIGAANSTGSVNFPISGSNDAFANAIGVPEPVSISLFGVGLAGIAGMGAFVRRRNVRKG